MNGTTLTGLPSMISLAKTMAWVAKHPRSPGHHFAALMVGVWMMNSSVSLSKVAVVSRPAMSEPWPNSV